MHHLRLLLTFLGLVLLVTVKAWAGPPLICHPHDIGSAPSLPWLATGTWNGADPNYDLTHLTGDTLALLGPRVPIPVRMETIRRAVIYAARQPGLSDSLESALVARTARSSNPLAWFDAGYLVETLRDASRAYANVPAQQPDGLSWMRKAQQLGGTGMEESIATVESVHAENR